MLTFTVFGWSAIIIVKIFTESVFQTGEYNDTVFKCTVGRLAFLPLEIQNTRG